MTLVESLRMIARLFPYLEWCHGKPQSYIAWQIEIEKDRGSPRSVTTARFLTLDWSGTREFVGL
jgi:hypothetical protein